MCPEQTIHSFPFNSDRRQYLPTWLSAYWHKKQQNTSTNIQICNEWFQKNIHNHPKEGYWKFQKGGETPKATFLQGSTTKTWVSRETGGGGCLNQIKPPWEWYGYFLEQHMIKIYKDTMMDIWRLLDVIYSWIWQNVVNTIYQIITTIQSNAVYRTEIFKCCSVWGKNLPIFETRKKPTVSS